MEEKFLLNSNEFHFYFSSYYRIIEWKEVKAMLLEIKNHFLTATIHLIGAELKSLKDQDAEYIWNSNPTYWHHSAPILFPAIGRFLHDTTVIDGKPYSIPKHGFVKDMRFEILNHQEDEITLFLDANDETLAVYPYQFRFIIHYKLINKSLITSMSVKNSDDHTIYFNIGGHPAFNCPIDPSESFTDYMISFPKEEQFNSPKVMIDSGTIDWNQTNKSFPPFYDLHLTYSDFKDDALIFNQPKSAYVTLQNNTRTKGIEFHFDGFNTLGIWTPSNIESPFVCLEPWVGCADSPDGSGVFVEKKDIIALKKNNTYHVNYTIIIK